MGEQDKQGRAMCGVGCVSARLLSFLSFSVKVLTWISERQNHRLRQRLRISFAFCSKYAVFPFLWLFAPVVRLCECVYIDIGEKSRYQF